MNTARLVLHGNYFYCMHEHFFCLKFSVIYSLIYSVPILPWLKNYCYTVLLHSYPAIVQRLSEISGKCPPLHDTQCMVFGLINFNILLASLSQRRLLSFLYLQIFQELTDIYRRILFFFLVCSYSCSNNSGFSIHPRIIVGIITKY